MSGEKCRNTLWKNGRLTNGRWEKKKQLVFASLIPRPVLIYIGRFIFINVLLKTLFMLMIE